MIDDSMKTSEAGIRLIKVAENEPLAMGIIKTVRVYPDAKGRAAIGYGCDVSGDELAKYEGRDVPESECDLLMRDRVASFDVQLGRLIAVPVNQNQWDALSDFIYEEGEVHLAGSTLLRKLNSGDYQGAADQFLVWDIVEGKHNAGVEARRVKDRELFLTPMV